MRFAIISAFALTANLLHPFTSGIYINSQANGTSPVQDRYDYVIVGAGIGGLVVANRLSEDPSGEFPRSSTRSYKVRNTDTRRQYPCSLLRLETCMLWPPIGG